MNDSLKEKSRQNPAGGFELKKRLKPPRRIPLYLGLAVCLAFFGILFVSTIFYPEAVIGPTGKIHSPIPGSSTGSEVRIVGQTKNITTGQHVWIALDKPRTGLCWPKTDIYGNTRFSAVIQKEPSEQSVRISLYILDETFHQTWKQWLERGTLGGLHLPPDVKRLDSVNLL